MTFKTPDLCDEFEAELGKTVRVLAPMFQRYGGRKSFSGQIVTLKIFEDNSLVREMFAENGVGKVLVIDGGGSLRCALVGDQLAILAKKNGWEGAVVYGCIRDSGDINEISRKASEIATLPSLLAASPSIPVNGYMPMKTASCYQPTRSCRLEPNDVLTLLDHLKLSARGAAQTIIQALQSLGLRCRR